MHKQQCPRCTEDNIWGSVLFHCGSETLGLRLPGLCSETLSCLSGPLGELEENPWFGNALFEQVPQDCAFEGVQDCAGKGWKEGDDMHAWAHM